MPMTHFMSVLLPLPLVPSSATVSPCLIPIDTPWSARTAPYPASIAEILSSSAKVGFLHVWVLDDLGRRALADDLAGVEADHALREAHHRLQDVLDHDHGDARLVQLEEDGKHLVDLGAGESRHRLVRDEQLRPRRHGARELEFAQLHLRQLGGVRLRLVGEAYALEEL